jgi:hypothetical protein
VASATLIIAIGVHAIRAFIESFWDPSRYGHRRWVEFKKPNSKHKKAKISDVETINALIDPSSLSDASDKLRDVYNGDFISLFAAVSPEEDFVETYKYLALRASGLNRLFVEFPMTRERIDIMKSLDGAVATKGGLHFLSWFSAVMISPHPYSHCCAAWVVSHFPEAPHPRGNRLRDNGPPNHGRMALAPRPQLPATHDASDISKASLIELNERLSTGKTAYGTCAHRLRRRLYPLTARIDRATVQPLSDRASLNSGWRVLSDCGSHSS